MARNTPKNTAVNLDTTFYRELVGFYKAHRGTIRSHYKLPTRVILDYNDPDKFRPGQFLRRPQFEALEIYIFLKEYCKLAPVHSIFDNWYHKKRGFESRGDVLGLGGRLALSEEFTFNEEAYSAIFKKMQATKQIYPNYIYALTMGVGKTLLMATCIFYEFVLASKFPNDPLYCHNALIFAPDKTVLQALREIESFDFSKVLPPEYANWLQANLSLQYLEEAGATLNVLNGSRYNLIISNAQKIILKRRNKTPSAAQQLFLNDSIRGTADASASVYDDIADLYGQETIEDEQELTINQRFLKLRNLPQLGIYVDEAHHAFGDALKKDLQDARKETSLRFSINALAKGLESQNSRLVACHNFTGTPYVKNEVLPEVVYAFGLDAAIRDQYLKNPVLHGYSNTRDKDFVRLVVDHFLKEYSGKRFENMLPKLVFFAPDIADANENLRPALERVLSEKNIPSSAILINVGDERITTNDDIRAFNELDTPQSEKQFIILVNKGKEGWNCRSLCGVAMFRQPRSKVFVLQATMRCLRSIGDSQEDGQIYLSTDNLQILNDELQQNFRLNTEEFQKLKADRTRYEVRVLKRKSITLTRVRHLYETKEKELKENVAFDMDSWDTERYRIIHTEQKMRQKLGPEKREDLTAQKERRVWTAYTLVAEIARYLCMSPLKIEKILQESREGLERLVSRVNEYNELLYDRVIPELFGMLYEVSEFERKESREIALVNDPEKGFFSIHGDPQKTELFSKWQQSGIKQADKTFHLDTYCFDSAPEHDFFKQVVAQDAVREIYFTGMLTHGQSDFYINYIDPDTHTVRSYYPDFLILTESGEWIVVEIKAAINMDDPVVLAKKAFAEEMLKSSRISYRMVPHTQAAFVRIQG